MRRISTLSILLLVATAPGGRAQLPTTLALQARLLTPGGQPHSGPVGVTTRLYDGPGPGTLLHTEAEVSATPDAAGVVDLVVGADPALAAGLLEDEVWITISLDGGPESLPRRLPASPQALRTPRAATAQDLAPAAHLALGDVRLTGAAPATFADDAARRHETDLADAGAAAQVTAIQQTHAAHVVDATRHFTQGAIVLTPAQVTDLDAAISASTHAGRLDDPHEVAAAQLGFTGGPSSLASPDLEAALGELAQKLGELDQLTTTTKTDLVSALNEVEGRVAALE